MSEVEYIAFKSDDPTDYNNENIVFSSDSWEGFIKECQGYIEVFSDLDVRAIEVLGTKDLFDILEEMFNISVNYRRIKNE